MSREDRYSSLLFVVPRIHNPLPLVPPPSTLIFVLQGLAAGVGIARLLLNISVGVKEEIAQLVAEYVVDINSEDCLYVSVARRY